MDISNPYRAVEVPVAEVLEDKPYQVKTGDGTAIAVYRLGNAFFAIDDVCTHEFAFLSEGYCESGVIECPLHQARFDVRTGATLGPPASQSLATYRTEVDGSLVRVFVAEDAAHGGRT